MTNKPMLAHVSKADFIATHPDLAAQDHECIVEKRHVGAFSGSDLEVLLRSFTVDHLVLTGIATSGVVLSTLREAADKDFRITVLSDASADRKEEVHDFFYKQGYFHARQMY